MTHQAGSNPKICVIGGGATGLSMLWALKSQGVSSGAALTLLHNQANMEVESSGVTIPDLGGHSVTVEIDMGEAQVGVDLGVQFVCPLVYPNLQRMLERPEFSEVHLDEHPALNVGVTINEQVNWGNFGAYQSGPLFGSFSELQGEMARFQLAVLLSLPHASQTLNEYFAEQADKRKPYSPEFIDYALFPYLSILNGYGGTGLLKDATFEEMIPLFVPLSSPGPLASFTEPGKGWQRFRGGSTNWINAMASYAHGQGGVDIERGAQVEAVFPNETGGSKVVWSDKAGNKKSDVFDSVVLTTDMETNGHILGNSENGYWQAQQKVIGQFDLKPGSCYIHHDDGVFPSYLTTRDSTVDFCAAYAKPEPGQSPPYDIAHTFATYNIQNMVPNAPSSLYLTMYGHDKPQHAPDPAKVYAKGTWKHGSFLGPQLREAARQVHQIQGMGNVWFAGNNTCQDSEEGALISAMVIAEKLFPDWKYPFPLISEAQLMYDVMKYELMFPASFARGLMSWLHWEKHKAKAGQ